MAAQEGIPNLPQEYPIPNSRDFREERNNTIHCMIHVNGSTRGDLDNSPTRIFPTISSFPFTFGVRVADDETQQDALIHAEQTETINVDHWKVIIIIIIN